MKRKPSMEFYLECFGDRHKRCFKVCTAFATCVYLFLFFHITLVLSYTQDFGVSGAVDGVNPAPVIVRASNIQHGDVSGGTREHNNNATDGESSRLETVQGIHFIPLDEVRIKITWMTPNSFVLGNISFTPVCEFGESPTNLYHLTEGISYTYTAGYFNDTLNTVDLDLTVLSDIYTPVFYRCGNPSLGWSEVYNFELQPPTVVNENTVKSNKSVAFVGDLGVFHGTDTILALKDFVTEGTVKAVIHAGDIAYADLYSGDNGNNSYIWVQYMNEINAFTPWVPYLTCPGNHDRQFDFAAYRNWFPMPFAQSGSSSPYWWSANYMGIHFLSFSMEHSFKNSSEQYAFMESDLIRANQNRDNVPWIIVYSHRPLYCTCVPEERRCNYEARRYRTKVEDLFYNQKVDVYICGHNHNYERTFPMYKEEAVQKDFINPKAPIYIINGAAGNPEPKTAIFEENVDWRAFCDANFDSGFLTVEPRRNALHFQYVHSKDRSTIDSFTITRN